MKKLTSALLVLVLLAPVLGQAVERGQTVNEGKKVTVVMNPELVKDCKQVGLIEAKGRKTLFYGYSSRRRTFEKLEERALAMGANTVLLFENKNTTTKTKLVGEAYLCPDNEEPQAEQGSAAGGEG